MSGPPLRLAVVGLGWAGTERHLPWLRRRPDVTVVGVMDRHPERVAAAQRRFGVPLGAVTTTGAAPWLDEVDAVTIATPPPTHTELAAAFLAAGKHVLTEKPMAMSVAEADLLCERAVAADRVLAVVHNFQFARAVRRLRALLASGRLGDLWSIEGTQLSSHGRRLPDWYEQIPLGLFYDESPHLLYLAELLAPAPLRLQSAQIMPSPSGRRTPAMVTAMFDGGVPVRLSLNFDSSVSEWQLIVIGSRRLALADIFRDILITVPNDGQHLGRNVLTTSANLVGRHLWGTVTSGLRLLRGRLAYGNDEVQARFVAATRDGRPPPGISAADGRRIVSLQHEILQAGERG